MTPETEALIARVRELEKRATEEGLTQPMGDELADAAPQLATALEAAEAKLNVARKALDAAHGYIGAINMPGGNSLLPILSNAIDQLKP